jgi:hypothetical protein
MAAAIPEKPAPTTTTRRGLKFSMGSCLSLNAPWLAPLVSVPVAIVSEATCTNSVTKKGMLAVSAQTVTASKKHHTFKDHAADENRHTVYLYLSIKLLPPHLA